jgi:hypothetical protein
MAAFDSTETAQTYSNLEVEELVRIAYLDPNYLEEAKMLAWKELDRRGIPKERSSLIEQMRLHFDHVRESTEAADYESVARIERLLGATADVV